MGTDCSVFISKKMKLYSSYTDFLKDEQFIRWQLLSDETQDAYWKSFIDQHPELGNEINRAIRYLKSTGLNANLLSPDSEQQMLRRIKHSLADNRKKQRIRRLYYFSFAASIAVLVAVGSILFFQKNDKMKTAGQQQEFIVGNLLNSEDIQLITGEGEAVSFKNDIQAHVDEKGNALKITDSQNAETKLDMRENTINKLVVPYGKRSQLTLADGTRLWLNSGSVLEFPSDFKGKTREITIEGEIYLDVVSQKEKPFFVHTKDFSVQVLGTKFNVSAYNNFSSAVTLVEGNVMLEGQSVQAMKLSANEKATLTENHTFDKKRVKANSEVSWIHGYLTLDETPMIDVLKSIERYYNFSFNYENDMSLQKRICSGKIYLSENIDDVMGTIALLTSTQYVKENNKIYISNKIN